jgi:membrane associated rhomboid family serine protease
MTEMMHVNPLKGNTRSGKILWQIVRIKMLSYKTQQYLLSGRKGRRLSLVTRDLTRILRSETHRGLVRSIKYGSNFSGYAYQIFDDVKDLLLNILKKPLSARGNYTPWWTLFSMCVYVSVFFFMAAEFKATTLSTSWTYGPHNLFDYLEPMTSMTFFTPEFLIVWGGQHLYRIVTDREWWRWFTASLLHTSIAHCFSNMLMYGFFGIITERVYGLRITIIVWCAAAIGGNFTAAALANPCIVLVGASGAVFGYFGFYCVDTAVRWNRIKRPTIRILMIMAFMGQALYSIKENPNISHWAHGGGMACGMACSIVLLPDMKQKRLRVFAPYASILIVLLCIIVFPSIVYSKVYKCIM